jgi:uncharacterized membrane protein YdjX (TVP38/TMEM64 family)
MLVALVGFMAALALLFILVQVGLVTLAFAKLGLSPAQGFALLFAIAAAKGVGGYLLNFQDWMENMGVLAPVIFIILFSVATVAVVPGSWLTVVAGAAFGSVMGIVVVSIGATVGAALCFLITRYLARDCVTTWLSRNPKFRKIDDLTEQYGTLVVVLLRLIPLLPFAVVNYGLGVTKVSFRTYLLWSALAMIPGTVVFVGGADAVVEGLVSGEIPWGLLVIFLVTAGLLTFAGIYARRRLQRDSGT